MAGRQWRTIDISKPFLLVIFHPTTTEYGGERRQMEELLNGSRQWECRQYFSGLTSTRAPITSARLFACSAIKASRQWLEVLINLSPENYLKVLANASCAVGNSSSFVRDASFFGTPVVLVGAGKTAERSTPM